MVRKISQTEKDMPYDFTSHVESIKPNDQTKHEQNHRYSEQNGGC